MGEKTAGPKATTTNVPGPGQYSIKSKAVGNISFSMGAKLQGIREKSPVPGPNAYNPAMTTTQKSFPQVHMHAKCNYENKKLNVPGPGQYAPVMR